MNISVHFNLLDMVHNGDDVITYARALGFFAVGQFYVGTVHRKK